MEAKITTEEQIEIKPGQSPIAAIAESMLGIMSKACLSEYTATVEISSGYLLTLTFKFEEIDDNDLQS